MKISSVFAPAVGIALAASIIAGCSSSGGPAAYALPSSAIASARGAITTSELTSMQHRGPVFLKLADAKAKPEFLIDVGALSGNLYVI
jgi:hypothetical protein